MTRTVEEINEKIKAGSIVVATAEEVVATAREKGSDYVFETVDVVTTGTFGAMCSSGAVLNFGHAEPPIRMSGVELNGIPVCAGLAAVDCYVGATDIKPGTKDFSYGGGHIIEDLIAGKDLTLHATSYVTDCYPRSELTTKININDLNQAYLFNPRNCYQNYNAATNSTDKVIRTYMGTLQPHMGNVTYCTAGELSPLLKDPKLRTIGIGTRIFFGGAQGYVAWEGTQFNMSSERITENGYENSGATLALIGDMKKMSTKYIRGCSIAGYGVSLMVGVGIPIPLLTPEIAADACVGNDELWTKIYDYGIPTRKRPTYRSVSYAELQSGTVELCGKKVSSTPNTSLKKSREIAEELKRQIVCGEFLLTEPVEHFDPTRQFNPLKIR